MPIFKMSAVSSGIDTLILFAMTNRCFIAFHLLPHVLSPEQMNQRARALSFEPRTCRAAAVHSESAAGPQCSFSSHA